MTVWCHLPTIFKQRYALRTAGLLALCVALTTTLLFANISRATTGINQTLSFQGRLLSGSGAVVADGHYNLQFKIYQDGNSSGSGTLKWTETYINNSNNEGVDVKNGYFSVALGTKNPFGTQVDWNQDTLWLSMNVAGSSNSCTTFNSGSCTADGEMLPMKRITSTPYALNSGMLGGKTADNFIQLAQGVQTDASTNTSSIYINKTGSGNLVQLQNTATDVFTVGNSGDVTLGNNANHTISIATSGASTAGRGLTISAGTGGSGTGSTGGALTLQGGAAGGTNGNGGSVAIDAGAKTGSGTAGSITIGSTNAGTVQIGTNGTTRATFDNTGNLALTAKTAIQADSSVALQVSDTSAHAVFTVNTSNKTVDVRTVDATTLPTLSVTQSTTSDAALSVQNASNNYYIGIDASDNNKFKIGSSITSTVTSGVTSSASGMDNGNNDVQACSLTQAKATGTVSTIHVRIGNATGNMAVALYNDDGSRNNVTTLIANSASTALTTSNTYQAFTLTSPPTVTAGTYYWICFNASSGSAEQQMASLTDGVIKGKYQTNVTYGTWPSPASVSNIANNHAWAVNMDIAPSATTDQFATSTFSIDQGGSATFRNTVNATNAFSVQTTGGLTLFNIDSNNENVRIGDGSDSGTPTLFTLDQATSAPTVDSSMLGSMYYDTTLGKVQCYTADGWGQCGDAPDTFITLSPEYSNAVTNGSGTGTMSSDLCSDTLNINDGSSGQPTVCGTNETYNFYNWTTSNPSTAQTKSIYVTYKLPTSFKEFVAGSASLMGRTDSSDSTVDYQIYRNNGSGLTACGSTVSVSTGSQSTWQQGTATSGNDPAACSFAAGDSIVFKINLTAKNNSNAYVSNLNFTFSNN